MKSSKHERLTKANKRAILRRVPFKMKTPTRKNRLKNKALKQERLLVVKRYQRFFIPPPPPSWQSDDNSSLEQPSPLKWVPSETTYGIGA
jgi:hypothetical protein